MVPRFSVNSPPSAGTRVRSGLFVIGSGLALLQTAINPYISILGPIETAARRIALMGICNKIAGMLAPVLIGTLVLHGIGDLDKQVQAADAVTKVALLNEFAAKIHAPYLAMAGLLVLLAVAVLFAAAGDQVLRGQRHPDDRRRSRAAASSSSRTCGWACSACSSTSAWK